MQAFRELRRDETKWWRVVEGGYSINIYIFNVYLIYKYIYILKKNIYIYIYTGT